MCRIWIFTRLRLSIKSWVKCTQEVKVRTDRYLYCIAMFLPFNESGGDVVMVPMKNSLIGFSIH